MKVLTATKLRENPYAVLDEELKTGVPAFVERKGRRVRIVVEEPPSKLGRLKRHDAIVGDPEDLVRLGWSSAWKEQALLGSRNDGK